MDAQDPDSLLASLKGQGIQIQDLTAFFKAWPSKVNIHLDRLRSAVDVWLQDFVGDSQLLPELKAADLGLFGATMWPEADWERLEIVTYLAAWLFCWDDEIDSDVGSFANDFERSRIIRAETLGYIRSSLNPRGSPCREEPSSRFLSGFDVIGEAIGRAYNVEQRERFMREMVTFIDMSRREQSMRLDRKVPSIEEFWEYRLGTSAVRIALAINEFAWGDMHLPHSIMEDQDMKALWNHTTVIIAIINDILSLKKEIVSNLVSYCLIASSSSTSVELTSASVAFQAHSSIHSLVPLLYASNGDLQSAVDQATDVLAKGVQGLEDTVKRFADGEGTFDAVSKGQIRDFIKGCRFYCSGNLNWSLSAGRYGINREDMSGGVYVEL